MDIYLISAPLLLLPVLFLWRLSGCVVDRSGLPSNTARTRAALPPCDADEHIVEFVIIFPKLATESKEDFLGRIQITSTVGSETVTYFSQPVRDDLPIDQTWTRDNPTRERFIFFGCVRELSAGQYDVECTVRRASDSTTVIEGSCTGGPPTVADLRVQFVGNVGDTSLAPTHCFATP